MRFLTLAAVLTTAALTAQSPLTTTFANNNANAAGGMVFFDLDVTDPAGIQIYAIDINTTTASGGIDFYTAPTTWVGNEANAAAWTLAGGGTFATGAGAGNPTQVCMGTGFYLPQGQYGVALAQIGVNQTYTTGTAPFQLVYSTAEVTLTAGASNNTQFSGAPFNPRVWNGSIFYNLGPVPGVCIPGASKEVYGLGCNREYASVYEEFAAGTNDLAGSKISWTATNPGQVGIIDNSGSGIVPVGTLGTPTAVALTDDSQAAVGSLGITVGSNGWVAFGAGNSNAFTPTVATMLANPAETFYFWHDLNPTVAGGSVQYEEAGTQALITYDQVANFGGVAGDNNIQVFVDTTSGTVEVRFDVVSAGGNGWIVGYSPAGANGDPGSTDLSAAGVVVTGAVDIDPLSLDSNNPSLGGSWDCTTTNIDAVSPFAITFFGARGPATPMTLIGLNAPGCDINLASILGDGTGINGGGSTTVSVPIPNNPALAGFMLAAQSICLTLTNGANLLTSNGVEGTLGL